MGLGAVDDVTHPDVHFWNGLEHALDGAGRRHVTSQHKFTEDESGQQGNKLRSVDTFPLPLSCQIEQKSLGVDLRLEVCVLLNPGRIKIREARLVNHWAREILSVQEGADT